MMDRAHFEKRAEAERAAAIAATDHDTCRKHMNRARDYAWRAATEAPAPPETHGGA